MQPADKGSRTQPPPALQADPSTSTTSTTPPQASGRQQTTTASISHTESSSPGKLQRARHQYLRPDRAYDDAPQVSVAALHGQAPSLFEMPRSENASPIMSPNPSRRPSILIQRDGDDKIEPRDKEGEKDDSLTSGRLRQSLMELDAFSTDATRTLNDTCDAMQEKMVSLQDLVIALKELAEATRDIQIGFERVSHEIESNVVDQLNSMGDFNGQQHAIEELQDRVHEGRRRIEALTARVNVVRRRVEGWEQADKSWQERTRKRLAITWTALSMLALVVVVLFVFVDYSHDAVAHSTETRSQPTSELQHDMNTCMAYNAQTLMGEETTAMTESETMSRDQNDTRVEWKTPSEGGEWLRALDEL